MAFSVLTAQQVADTARARHPAFTPNVMPDGALFLEADRYQRTLLLRWARDLMPLVGLASAPIVAADPNAPVYPIPANLVWLGLIWATFQDGSTGPVDLVDQWTRFEQPQTRDLQCYALGGTLYPVRDQPQAPFTDGWLIVASLTIYGIQPATITGAGTVLTLPDTLAEAVTAHLAMRMAMSAKDCGTADKQFFMAEAKAAEADVARLCESITGDAMQTTVIYRGS